MSFADQEIQIDQIIRSRRRTISLEINRDGSLIVRAPLLTRRGEIEALVKTKAPWIRKNKTLIKKQALEAPSKRFVAGEQFLYLGKSYPLVIVDYQESPLILKDQFYLAAAAQESGCQVFEKWYRQRASEEIINRVTCFAQNNGFDYSHVRITRAKTRWGSCSSKGSLNFTWRLVMAPIEVIDYVVVHELVHLRIRNHSKDYWQAVSKVMPDYQIRLGWLKENGHRLTLD